LPKPGWPCLLVYWDYPIRELSYASPLLPQTVPQPHYIVHR
jgi:hypothetical protein